MAEGPGVCMVAQIALVQFHDQIIGLAARLEADLWTGGRHGPPQKEKGRPVAGAALPYSD